MLKNFGIRNKLLICYSIIFILCFSLDSAYIYYSVRQTIAANIENEMKNSSAAVLSMVKTAAAVTTCGRFPRRTWKWSGTCTTYFARAS